MNAPDPVQTVLAKLTGVKHTGPDQWQARCPAHDDTHPSLSIGRGQDGRALVDCKAGCSTLQVLRALGLKLSDLYGPDTPRGLKRRGRVVATYDYRDAEGTLLFQKLRYEPKDFRIRRPDGRGGWKWRLGDTPRVLYRLPELLAARKDEWIFVVEGEKDADRLAELGLLATTNPGGAGKWKHLADDSPLHGRRVAVVADLDPPGRAHARDVAARLAGKAAVVRIVELPEMPPKQDGTSRKDVSDWIEWLDGRTSEQLAAALRQMAQEAPEKGPREAAASGGPVLQALGDVAPAPVRWLWPSRIALGKLTLIAGDPGLGKSFLTLDLAARVSRGGGWPDHPAATYAPGGVVLLSAEDDLADTIRPRLDAAGADVKRIQALLAVKHFDFEAQSERQHPFSLAEDLPALEAAIADTPDCRLVVIDPISAYLGRTDSHKNAEIRGLLAPLSQLAAHHSVALVAVTHLRKGEGPAMYRAMGSLAFVAAARAVYAVTRDKADPSGRRRLLLPVKNNLGNDRDGLAYRLDDSFAPNGQPVVGWEAEPVSVSADEALRPDGGRREADTSDREEAEAWLREALADGPHPAREIVRDARRDGITKRTLDRAKRRIGVVAAKEGFDAGWTWRLPGAPEERHLPTQGTLATFGEVGNLRRVPEETAQERHLPTQETLATFGEVGNLREKPKEYGDSGSGSSARPCEGCQVPEGGNLREKPKEYGRFEGAAAPLSSEGCQASESGNLRTEGDSASDRQRQVSPRRDVATFADVGNLRENAKENAPSGGASGGRFPEGCQVPEGGNLRLDPKRPGPTDRLSKAQYRRYQHVYHAHDGTPNDKHETAWRAAVGGES